MSNRLAKKVDSMADGGMIETFLNFGSAPANVLMWAALSMDDQYGGAVEKVFTKENAAIYVGHTMISTMLALGVAVVVAYICEELSSDINIDGGVALITSTLMYVVSRYLLLGRYFMFAASEIIENEKKMGKILGLVENALYFVVPVVSPRLDDIKVPIWITLGIAFSPLLICIVRTMMFPGTEEVGKAAFFALSSPFSANFLYALLFVL